MDPQVLAAMARWPGVPDVYGWLHVDARGGFRLRAGDGFATIGNPALAAFIARNYQPDARGCWYFQNGPQRVYASLALTPLVYRFDGSSPPRAQTGADAARVHGVLIDEHATVVLLADPGPGAIDDRDLAAFLSCVVDAGGTPATDAAVEAWLDGSEVPGLAFAWQGRHLPLARILRAQLGPRLGFDPEPRAAASA
ncbi:MAG: DUF2946 family protein [Burkholderiales bacterium]|nr:DUF2946 family protein [Burkholderiales bacterium]